MDITKQDLRCREILFLINYSNDFICPKCNYKEFYVGSNFELICKNCAFKCEATRNTIFHNTRIGLHKYFKICVEYKKNDYCINYKVLTEKYNLSVKTAYRIIGKLKRNKTLVDEISAKYALKDSTLNKEVNLIKYLNT
jgi:hypothetical protein|tara:strand:- start:2213 stop:2629 length:417 start_codon:yes stop_codon:yes gene_type:complete